MMLQQHREQLTPQQSQPVDIVCLRCRELTETKGGGTGCVDEEPLWTLGECRPLYLCRTPPNLSQLHQAREAVREICPEELGDTIDLP